jgi:D-sedoheptulose 7-phosphate isomerase
MNLKSSSMQHLDKLFKRYPELAGLRDQITRSSEMICDTYRNGGKVLVCGNGGSAADSEHIVGELMKGFVLRRELTDSQVSALKAAGYEDWKELAQNLQQGLPAIALTGHNALSSAVLNDNDPYMTYAQQAFSYGRAGDVLIGISTSGNARNVVNAIKVGRAFGLRTIGFTGSRPSKMDEFCDVMIKVPATETFKIQEFHLPVYHTVCIIVENEMFGD